MATKIIKNTLLVFGIIALMIVLGISRCNPASAQQPNKQFQPQYSIRGDAYFMNLMLRQINNAYSMFETSDLPYNTRKPYMDTLRSLYNNLNYQLYIQDSLLNSHLKVDTTNHKK